MPENPSQLNALLSNGQLLNFSKRDVIINEMLEPEGIFVIEKGFVKVYTISNDGEEFINVIWGKGDTFPFTWAYLRSRPQLFYEALDAVQVWRIPLQGFINFINANADQSNLMARQLARQYQTLIDRIDNLEYKTAEARVAYCLLFMARQFGNEGDGIYIDAPVTHDIIASTIKLARESVSREIGRLVDQGIIAREGKRIVIRDIEKLKKRLG